MKIGLRDILDFIFNLPRYFYRLEFFLVTEVIILVFYLWITSLLPAHLELLLREKFGNLIYYLGWSGIIFIILLAVVMYWFFYRRFPKFKSNELGIVFVYDFDPAIQNTIEKLLKRIKDEIKFGIDVSVKIATPNNLPKDLKDVHRKRVNSNSKVVVWGNIYNDKDEDGKVISLKKIYFSSEAAIVPINPKEVITVMPNFRTALQGRKLDIHEKFSFTDIGVVSKNISEIVLFILGSSLFLHGKNENAIKILLKLMQIIKNSEESVFEKEFCTMCRNCLADAYYRKAQEILNPIRGKINSSKEAEKALIFLNDALKLNDKWQYYVELSYTYFLVENYKKCKKAIKIAKGKAPKGAAEPYYSKAFLGMFLENNIDKALREYSLAFKKQMSPSQIIEVAEFINNFSKKYPGKLFLSYALGLINKEKIDASCAIKDFETFIEKSKTYIGQVPIDKYVKFARDNIAEIKKEKK